MKKLNRPIVWFDIESTGLDRENDRIVELCMVKQMPNGDKIVRTRRFNPQIPIPVKSSEIHGIYYDDIKDCPPFSKFAKSIKEFIQDCDLGGFNSNNFDIPMLVSEMQRSGHPINLDGVNFIDVGNIFKRQHERTLEAGYKLYCGKELDGAHSAEADVLATIEVFEKQIESIDMNVEELSIYCNYDKKRLDISGKFVFDDDNETILLNFGKHKGEPALQHLDFVNWMVTRGSFAQDTYDIAYKLLNN